MRRLPTSGLILGVLAAAAAPAGAAAKPPVQLCTQIKGPHASWNATKPKLTLSGNTWTIATTNAKCSEAEAAAPGLLAQWGRSHKGGARLHASGWICVVTPSPGS